MPLSSYTRNRGRGQFWYQVGRMPIERVPVFVGHLRVIVDFDLSDLDIVKGFTPRSNVNHPHMQDAWYIDGNTICNPTSYAGFVEFGHHTAVRSKENWGEAWGDEGYFLGSWVPGQFFAQRAADTLARKYAEKVGKYIEANVDKIFSTSELTIHFKVGM